jgi:hypothetical protein
MRNFSAGGGAIPNPTNIPLGTPPPPVLGVGPSVANNTHDFKIKDEYDAFIFQLKEHTAKDPSKVGTDLSYTRMLGVLNTIAYSYHDNISRTTDNSKDEQYKQTYLGLVASELASHPEWAITLQTDFKDRCSSIENQISRNADVIRAFYSRNAPATGDWVPMYITVYGNSSIDVTTQSEVASGKLQSSDQFNGAYAVPLVKGTSVASNYWKGKSVLEIRYASDKSPVGSGRVVVHDTGGMSNNVIDYYCGDDKELYKSIQGKGTNNGGKTKPTYAAPIEVRLVSGGVREGRTL